MAADNAPNHTLEFVHRANISRFRELLSRSEDDDLRKKLREQIAREEYELLLLADPSSAVSADPRFRLAAIAESSDDAIVGKDLNGIVTAWNKAAESMFGYKAEEIVGQPITIIIPPHRIDEEASILDRVRRGEKIVHFETERQRKDGGIIWVSLTVSPIRDDEGRIIGVSKIARDLTKRQEGERRINELQAELVHVTRVTELGQMVSALAHEVNQPLAAMTNYAAAAHRLLAIGNQEGASQVLERIAEQIERARKIIQQLRDFVSKRETERRIENLKEVIEQASSLALIDGNGGVNMEIVVDDDAAEALIDKIQIQQVLLNLIRNAREAMAESPRRELSIVTARAGHMVEISVADTGPGLPEAIRGRLFQPFVTTKRNGMGVGLSVCRTIVEAHGGRLIAEDRDSGGTIFHLTVPHVT